MPEVKLVGGTKHGCGMGIVFGIVEKLAQIDSPRLDLIPFQGKAAFHINIAQFTSRCTTTRLRVSRLRVSRLRVSRLRVSRVRVNQDATADISNTRIFTEKA